MKNKNNLLVVLLVAVVVLLSWGLTENYNQRNAPAPLPDGAHVCKEDSLQSVINQMIVDKESDEDGWDKKEQRYEDIMFEYNYGLDYLKNYYPDAYKSFHRIISHRERYSKEYERENNKRLNYKDEHN
jgi:hypothetical protein